MTLFAALAYLCDTGLAVATAAFRPVSSSHPGVSWSWHELPWARLKCELPDVPPILQPSGALGSGCRAG